MTRRTRNNEPPFTGMEPFKGSNHSSPRSKTGSRQRSSLANPEFDTVSPIAPHLEMPGRGEEIAWTSFLRADLPLYVMEQLREAAHRRRCTIVSLLLRMMAGHCDAEGRPLFYVRPEDLVPDRRRLGR